MNTQPKDPGVLRIKGLLTGYELVDQSFENGDSTTERVFSDRAISGIGSSRAKRLLDNPVAHFFSFLSRAFTGTALRGYAVMFFTFGILTLLLNFGNYYFGTGVDVPLVDLIVGAAFTTVSIPLFFSETPLAVALQESVVTDTLFFEMLCLRRIRHQEGNEGLPLPVSIAIGVVPAVLCFIFPLPIVMLSLGALIFFTLSLASPEFPFFTSLLAIPLLPLFDFGGWILAALTAVSMLSFAWKVLLGKRVYHFEHYDLLLILLGILILSSGIFNGGGDSFFAALILIFFTAGYTLAGNLIVNRRLADSAINLFLFSSVPTAAWGIVRFFLDAAQGKCAHPAETGLVFDVPARAASTFDSPETYAVFLLVALIFSASYMLERKQALPRLLYTLVFLSNLFAFVLTFAPGAWLAFVLSVLGVFIIRARRASKVLLLPLSLVPMAPILLSVSSIAEKLALIGLSTDALSHRFSILKASVKMVLDNLFLGVGIGEENFVSCLPAYGETAGSAECVYLEIACEAGIPAFLFFLLILIARLRHLKAYSPYLRHSTLTLLITMATAAAFSLVAFGSVDYIFAAHELYYLFWIVFGIGAASLRVAKKEHDERLGYYGDEISTDSAALDISVAGI